MKDLNLYLNESNKGSKFKETVSYSKADFDKWVKLWRDDKLYKQDVIISPYSKDTEVVLVYWVNKNTDKAEHIASYNVKDEVLMTDDIKLFGN